MKFFPPFPEDSRIRSQEEWMRAFKQVLKSHRGLFILSFLAFGLLCNLCEAAVLFVLLGVLKQPGFHHPAVVVIVMLAAPVAAALIVRTLFYPRWEKAFQSGPR